MPGLPQDIIPYAPLVSPPEFRYVYFRGSGEQIQVSNHMEDYRLFL